MKNIKFFLLIIAGLTIVNLGVVFSSSKDDIQFPVAELGGCESEKQCKGYCDKPENIKQCVGFAEKHNLLSEDEIEKVKRFINAGSKGPGGCDSQKSCEEYCNNINNINECLAFAETHGMMDAKELEEAKKVQLALAKGAKLPGGCENKNECEQYCENPEHMEECITFAQTAGFIPPDELEDARKALSAIRKRIKPPPCRGKKECDNYCSEPQNFESCLVFAEAAGFINKEEAEMARKTGGKGPGGCRGREECDSYCQESGHMEECINFGIEHNLIPEDEREGALKAAEALKRGVKMPNCRGKNECDEYCQKPENVKECVDFAEAAGFMKPEESAQARKTMELGLTGGPGGCKSKEECEEFCRRPENTKTCLDFAAKSGMMPPEESERIKNMMREGPPSEKLMEREFRQMERPDREREFKEEMPQIPPEFREIIPRETSPSGIQMPPEFRQIIPQEFQQFIPPNQQLPPSSEPMPQILPFKNLINNARALILEILR